MFKDANRDAPSAGFGAALPRLRLDELLSGPLRSLVFTQVSYARDLWGLAKSVTASPSDRSERLQAFWNRWASPATWLAAFNGEGTRVDPPPMLHFVVDGMAEATAEQTLRIPGTIEGADKPLATPLKNVLGRGQIGARHVACRFTGRDTARVLNVALADLLSVNESLASGALDPGVYVGAILATRDAAAPIALIQLQIRDSAHAG
jgi:hypothetical protein